MGVNARRNGKVKKYDQRRYHPRFDLRHADMRDADILLQWRNDPAMVSNSISEMPVEADQHLAWFERVMADPESVLMIGETDGTRIGMVRVDLAETEVGTSGTVSINIAPEARGQGYGRALLGRAISQLEDKVSVFHASVLNANISSQRLFESLQFVCIAQSDNVLLYELRTDIPEAR